MRLKFLNNIVSIFVILIISFIIIPLPPFLLDMMLIINITLSITILLMTMRVATPSVPVNKDETLSGSLFKAFFSFVSSMVSLPLAA